MIFNILNLKIQQHEVSFCFLSKPKILKQSTEIKVRGTTYVSKIKEVSNPKVT